MNHTALPRWWQFNDMLLRSHNKRTVRRAVMTADNSARLLVGGPDISGSETLSGWSSPQKTPIPALAPWCPFDEQAPSVNTTGTPSDCHFAMSLLELTAVKHCLLRISYWILVQHCSQYYFCIAYLVERREHKYKKGEAPFPQMAKIKKI